MTGRTYSYLNEKCEARETPRGGFGVYAKSSIQEGELVCMWGGYISKRADIDPAMPRFAERVLQIEEDLFLVGGEEKEPTDCFNHSCDPDLGFVGQIGLVALREIEAGAELTFDYAMSDGEAYDEFDCRCGSPNCRKRITGNDWQLPELWARYQGYFSPYLARRIDSLVDP